MSKSHKRRTEDYDGFEYDSYGTNERERSLSPPPPPKISKADVKKTKTNIPPPKKLQIKLNNVKSTVAPKPKLLVASVFNQESDSEPEEMPPEAKMRMRNIGRDTPTSAGPNSFGKTKHGFCDAKKVFEKSLKEAMNSTDCD